MVGRAVADFVAEGRCVVFATVVHETDVARVNVGLGKLAVGGNVGPGATYLDLHHAIGRLDGQGVDGFVGGTVTETSSPVAGVPFVSVRVMV